MVSHGEKFCDLFVLSRCFFLYICSGIFDYMATAYKKTGIKGIEAQWRREEDARTLARYQEIMGDSRRKAAAISEAKRQAAELEKRSSLMRKASGGKLR